MLNQYFEIRRQQLAVLQTEDGRLRLNEQNRSVAVTNCVDQTMSFVRVS